MKPSPHGFTHPLLRLQDLERTNDVLKTRAMALKQIAATNKQTNYSYLHIYEEMLFQRSG